MSKIPLFRKNYLELKSRYPEVLFLLRVKSRYEALGPDAEALSQILDLKSTTNTETGEVQAGFPDTSLDVNLPKLLKAGYRVAVANCISETPKKSKA